MLEMANKRVEQLNANGFAQAAVYDPPGVGGTRGDGARLRRSARALRPASRSHDSDRRSGLWKGPLKWIGNLAMVGGLLGVLVHYVRFGRKDSRQSRRKPRRTDNERRPSHRTVRVSRALVHALAALSYVYLLLTGLAFWTPALYWIAVVLGGGYLSRAAPPMGGLGVCRCSCCGCSSRGARDMRITAGGSGLAQRNASLRPERGRAGTTCRALQLRAEELFWLMVWGGVALLLSGLVMWFVASIPWELRGLRYAATLVHAVAALVTIGGFIIHRLHGHGGGAGGLHADHSRRRDRGVGRTPSPAVARTGAVRSCSTDPVATG